jgi:hypothetical protein
MPVTALVTPGAGGHQRHAHIAGGAGIAVGGMHGGLLVAHQHVLNGVLLVERVVDVEHRAAGIAPDVLHAFGLQGLDEDFGTHELSGNACGMRSRPKLSALEISMINLCEFL